MTAPLNTQRPTPPADDFRHQAKQVARSAIEALTYEDVAPTDAALVLLQEAMLVLRAADKDAAAWIIDNITKANFDPRYSAAHAIESIEAAALTLRMGYSLQYKEGLPE